MSKVHKITMTSYEDCCEAGQFCKGKTRATCFSCGQAVCVNCSSKRKYYKYGKVRLCDSCQIVYDGNDKVVDARNKGKNK